ncbi:MAG: hypothetical protein RIS35_2276 [Pseudomonadota bacterium]|jgi:type IV pilus assembly protein PilP
MNAASPIVPLAACRFPALRVSFGVRHGRVLLLVASLGALAGCGGDQQELRDWMREQRKTVMPRDEPVPAPKRFEPFRFEPGDLPDPFSPARMSRKTADAGGGRLKPDLTRRREALEGFPLDAIRMVGHLRNPAGEFALLQADNLVYRVQVGNHAGQNFGRIVAISENEVRLRELVQDGAGDWTERDTVLQLQSQQETRK